MLAMKTQIIQTQNISYESLPLTIAHPIEFPRTLPAHKLVWCRDHNLYGTPWHQIHPYKPKNTDYKSATQ